MDQYSQVFGKPMDKEEVKGLCCVFQKASESSIYEPLPSAFIINYKIILVIYKKSLFIISFLVILHKSATSTVTFTKHIYFK